MSNDEYQHQNSWKDTKGKHKELYNIVCKQIEKDIMIWGEAFVNIPSLERIHPLDIIVNDTNNNI